MTTMNDLITGQAAPDGNEYDSLIAKDQAQQSNVRKATFRQAQDVNPDQFAEADRIASTVGLPTDVVHRNLQNAKVSANNNEYDRLMRQSPTLANKSKDQNFVLQTHDDASTLSEVEKAVKGLPLAFAKGLGGSFNRLATGTSIAAGGLPVTLDAITSAVTGRKTTALQDWYFKHFTEPTAAKQSAFAVPADASFAEKASNSLGDLLGLMAQITLTGPEGAALAPEAGAVETATNAVTHAFKAMATPAISSALDTWRQVYAKTGDNATAGNAAAAQYLTSIGFGVIPLSAPGNLLTRSAGGALSFADLGEAARQYMNTVLPQDMQSQFNPEDLALNMLLGSVMGAVQGPRAAKAHDAQQNMSVLQRLSKTAADSKLRKRNPDLFRQFIKDAAQDGNVTSDIYINADKLGEVLNQGKVTPKQLRDQMPEVAAQFDEALQTHSDIRIPVADYAARIAGTPIDEAILPHLKTDPEGLTFDEAQTYYQDQAKSIKQQADTILASNEANDAFKESAQRVYDNVLGQLGLVNRFSPDVNKAYATLTRDFYTTQAHRLGMTPEDFFNKYPLRITAESVGPNLGQEKAPAGLFDKPSVTLELNQATPEADMAALRKAGLKFTQVEGAYEGNKSPSYVVDISKPEDYQKVLDIAAVHGNGGAGQETVLVTRGGQASLVDPRTGKDVSQLGRVREKPQAVAERHPGYTFDPKTNKYYVALPGARDLTGVHYSQAKRDVLEGSKYGTGMRGAESRRIMNSEDPRLLQRIYSYVDEGKGVTPESGVGRVPHRIAMKDLYDLRENPLKLSTKDVNALESQLLDLGYNGYYVSKGAYNQGRAVLIGEASKGVKPITDRRGVLRGPDRRQNLDFRKKVADLTAEERGRQLLTSEKTLLPNERAYNESDKTSHQAFFDLDNFKEINDVYSYTGADEILGLVGRAVQDAIDRESGAKVLPFHLHGDEFAFKSNDPAALERVMKNVQEMLTGTRILVNHEDGRVMTKDGIGMSYGVGTNRAEAEKAAKVNKAERAAAGLRFERPPEEFNQSVSLRRGKETLKKYGLNPDGVYTTREIAAALEARQREKYGTISKTDRSPEAASRIAKWMKEEVLFELEHPAQSGAGWYSYKFQNALNLLGEQHPELLTSPASRDTLTALIAIASDGQNVLINMRHALEVYGNFKKNGLFEAERGSQRQGKIGKNFKELQKLYDNLGAEGTREYLLQEHTVRELKKMADKLGYKFNTDFPADSKLPMAAVLFGPKIGSFYANLMGSHGYLTMDRWWSRTFNRYRGTLTTKATKSSLESFKKLLGRSDMSDEEAISASVAPTKAYDAKGYKNGTPIEKAANTIYKNTFENLQDAPFNPKDREFMQEVTNKVQKSLKRSGRDVSIADIQAVLWYYEKRLYGELGARSRGADISFEDAARNILGKTSADVKSVAPGEELYQPGGPNRGAFNPESNTIALLQNADLSTYLHETGHFMLEMQHSLVNSGLAPQQMRADYQTVMNWFGVDPARWANMSLDEKRPYHEKFAESFEAYLFRGKAPSLELQNTFQRFRAWLISIYKSLTNIGNRPSREVQGVFDRMLATDEAIQAAETARNFVPMFNTAAEADMTPQQFQDYKSINDQATADAKDELSRRGLRDMQYMTNAMGRETRKLQRDAAAKRTAVEEEVKQQLLRDPFYAAREFVTKGDLVDGYTPPNREAKRFLTESGLEKRTTKLNIADLKDMYAERPSFVNEIPSNMKSTNGVHPDIVANLFGLSSGDELVQRLVSEPTPETVIEGTADRLMLERYGDLNSPDTIARAAEQAIHNKVRVRMLSTEYNALAKMTGKKPLVTKAAREYADQSIATKKISALRPAQYTAGEAKAARLAEQAMKKGDTAEAAAQKRAQILNNYFYRAASQGVDDIKKALTYFKRFTKDSTRKNLDPDYRDQIDSLLEQYDLKPSTTLKEIQKRKSLNDWIESQRAQGFEPVLDDRIINAAKKVSYKDLTLEEMRGLRDTVKNIEHLARLKNKLLKIQAERNFAEVVDYVTTGINDNATKSVKAPIESNTWTARAKRGTKEFFAMHRKFASLAREVDGFDNGPMWDTFIRPMNDAGDREAVMREQATLELQKIFEPIIKEGGLRKKTYIPAIHDSLSKEGRLAIGLNWGRAENRQRILDGEHWTPDQAQAVLDTLSKSDWDFIQNTWDYIGSYWPEADAKNLRVTGLHLGKSEPAPVQTKYGEYKGGYYPVKYDPTRSTKASADAEAEAVKNTMLGLYTRATTRRGYTKDILAEVSDRPIRKDLGGVFEHISEVIHDVSWHEYLIDANRLLRSKPVDGALRDHYGPEVLKQMSNALRDIAAGDLPAQNAFESSINHIRTGASIAAMGWNLFTAALQPLGLTQSFARVGPKYMARGIADFLGSAVKMENAAKGIYEKSDFMRLRGKTLQREISEIRNKVSRSGKLGPVSDSFFYLISKLQLVADIPTWLGEYHKAIDMGNNEKRAVALADQAVIDSQGGGQIKDLAAIQRGGPMMKLWTNFYSYFNVMYNLTAESYHRTSFKKPGDVGRFAVDMLLISVLPSALSTLMYEVFRSPCKGDTKCILKELAKNQVGNAMGMVVGLRDLGGAVSGFDYKGPPGLAFFANTSSLIQQAEQGEVDKAMWHALNSTGGVLFHYPSGQVQRSVDGIWADMQGQTQGARKVTAPLMGPGLKGH